MKEKKIFLLISFLILFIVFALTLFPKIIDLFEGISMYGGYDEKSKVFFWKKFAQIIRTS